MVVGDDEDVAALDRGAAHVVALRRVAVAVGAEEHEHPAGRHAADRGERLLERVGGVAEVDVDRRTALARDALGATGQVGVDAAVAFEGRDDAVPRVPRLEDHHDRESGVRGHVPADDRHDRGQRAAVRGP